MILKSVFTQELVIHLKKSLLDKNHGSNLSREALLELDQWSGKHGIDEIGPTIFYEFIFQLFRETYADELPVDLLKIYSKRNRIELLDDYTEQTVLTMVGFHRYPLFGVNE